MSWNKHNINNLLLNPSLVSPTDIEQLQQLCLDYPYSGLFALTYLQALNYNADIRLGKELPKYAYLISDRTRLFQLLHQTVIEVIPHVHEEEDPPAVQNLPVEEALIINQVLGNQKVGEVPHTGQMPIVSRVETDPLDQLIKESVAATIYSLELEKLAGDGTIKEEEPQHRTKNSATLSIETKSFTDWLGQSEVDKIRPVEVLRIERPSVDFYNPVKKAKESVNAENIPVSETLAKIFALQGNYPKAKQIYEQLILTFPEKKAYFASQIKKFTKKEA